MLGIRYAFASVLFIGFALIHDFTNAMRFISSPSSPLKRAPNYNSIMQELRPPSGQAVIYTDLKLDDCAMIHQALISRKYSRIHIVTTAVQDHNKAHGHLEHYLVTNKVRERNGGYTDILVYRGGDDVLEQPASKTHEHLFLGSPVRTTLDARNDLPRNLLTGKSVDIYHIAPTDANLIWAFIGATSHGQITMYHHVSGYNSLQDRESHINGRSSPKTRHFLENMRRHILQKSPAANVFYTNSQFSFVNNGGSTQPIKYFRDRISEAHLTFALRDPFFVRKLTEADAIVRPRVPKLQPLNPAEYAEKFSKKSLQDLITQARIEENTADGKWLRNYFTSYTQYVIRYIEDLGGHAHLLRRLKTGVIDAFTKETSIELCDAVQAVSLNYVRINDLRQHVVPVHWYMNSNGIITMRVAEAGEEVHGHSLQGQTSSGATALLQTLMPPL